MSLPLVRLYRVPGIRGLQWSYNSPVWPPLQKWTRSRILLLPTSRESSRISYENFCIQFCQQTSNRVLQIQSPVPVTEVQLLADEFTYEYKTAFMGHASIVAACVWSFAMMPNGGWFALLFKDIALPVFGAYSAVRASDACMVMRGSEKFLENLRSGNFEISMTDNKDDNNE